MRKLATNLKRLKSLACLEIDLSLVKADYSLMLRFFESLKHFKNHSKLHFFYSESMQSPIIDHQAVLSISQALSQIRHFPQEEIKLSLSIFMGICLYNSNFCQMLESIAGHVTCLELTLSRSTNRSYIKQIISIFKKSQSLSQVSLTFDEYSFFERTDLQSCFQDFKELKLLTRLNVYFKNCYFSYKIPFRSVGFLLQKTLQVPTLKVIFEEKKSPRTKLGWWLFNRAFQDHKYIQNFQAKFIGKLQIMSRKTAVLLFFIFLIVFLPLFFTILIANK